MAEWIDTRYRAKENLLGKLIADTKLIYSILHGILTSYTYITHIQVDAKLNVISSCNYDGTGRNLVLHSTDTLKHPFSITTFEDYVYWTDWDKEAVFRADKFNGKDVEPVTALHMVRSCINDCVLKR